MQKRLLRCMPSMRSCSGRLTRILDRAPITVRRQALQPGSLWGCAFSCGSMDNCLRPSTNVPARRLLSTSRSEVINAEKHGAEAGEDAGAEKARARSPGGCGVSPLTGAPAMASKLEQKAIDELEDMSIIDDDEDAPLAWKNPATGEVGGPRGSLRGAEPTRFGDWEQNGRVSDF